MSENGKSAEKKIKDKTEALISEIREKGKSLLDQGIETARDVYDERKKVVRKKADEFQDKSVEEIVDDVKVYVRRNPVQSLGIAAGIGVLLGMIFKSDD